MKNFKADRFHRSSLEAIHWGMGGLVDENKCSISKFQYLILHCVFLSIRSFSIFPRLFLRAIFRFQSLFKVKQGHRIHTSGEKIKLNCSQWHECRKKIYSNQMSAPSEAFNSFDTICGTRFDGNRKRTHVQLIGVGTFPSSKIYAHIQFSTFFYSPRLVRVGHNYRGNNKSVASVWQCRSG